MSDQLMAEIFIASIIGYFLFVEICILWRREFRLDSALYGLAYTLAVATAAAANFEMEIFEQKFASEFAYDIFKGQESLRSNSMFWLQAILSFPAFLLTDAWHAAIGTNVAMMGAVFYFVHAKSPRLSLIMLAPAIINFSMFALRDPLIAALVFLVTLSFLAPKITDKWFQQGFWTALFLFIRPENLAIFGYSKLVTIFDENKRSALLYFSFPVLVLLGGIVTAFTPQLLGVEFEGSITEVSTAADEFYQARGNRWDAKDAGGGSNILGGRLTSMPIVVRFPIQVFTFFVLPLPFEIRHLGLALAFLDSIVFCSLVVIFHRYADRKAIIIFWIYVLAVAFFANNYGNVFRLRLPAYFVIIAGMLRK